MQWSEGKGGGEGWQAQRKKELLIELLQQLEQINKLGTWRRQLQLPLLLYLSFKASLDMPPSTNATI
jgi:hypothetical protein